MKQRIFFALWPDAQTRNQLEVLAASITSKPVSTADFHMTLAFLGNCNIQEIRCAEEIAADLKSVSFQLVLDSSGRFNKVDIQWLGLKHPPDALLHLQTQLVSRLAKCGFSARLTDQYRPHVTLARHIQESITLEITQLITWNVNDFVLLESCPERLPGGGFYKVLKCWPLNKVPEQP